MEPQFIAPQVAWLTAVSFGRMLPDSAPSTGTRAAAAADTDESQTCHRPARVRRVSVRPASEMTGRVRLRIDLRGLHLIVHVC